MYKNLIGTEGGPERVHLAVWHKESGIRWGVYFSIKIGGKFRRFSHLRV